MIIIKDFLIEEYINRLSLDEIIKFSLTQGIELTPSEAKIIYDYIKKDWRTFMYGNPRKQLDEIKQKVNPYIYQKIETLYIKFKGKIS